MVYCQSCGTQNQEQAKYCIKCGNKLEVTVEEGVSEYQVDKSNTSSLSGKKFTKYRVFGIVFALLSLFVGPIIFGAISFYFGMKLKKMGDEFGVYIQIVAVVFAIIGTIYGAIVWTNIFSQNRIIW